MRDWANRYSGEGSDLLGVERAEAIDWSHERLAPLSNAARLVYACLVDGLSVAARDTIDSVDLVWRTRHRSRTVHRFALRDSDLTKTLDEICLAVEELIDGGLVVLGDASTIRGAWVVRPWESSPS